LRAEGELAAVHERVREELRSLLRDAPVSYPNRGHVTMRAFPAGTDLDAIRQLVEAWAGATRPLRLEVDEVSVFGSPFQIVVVVIRKTPELADAYRRLLEQALRAGLPDWPGAIAVDDWIFHLSAAYCGGLDDPAWQRVVELAKSLTPNEACELAAHVELVAFDERGEHVAGRFALRA
jgi:2'-5' RNA ligase